MPLKVVREAALNLLTHRTWWSEARVPSVNIFDDRVEFMSPGAFPLGTTPNEFLHKPHSEPVNEKIAGALFSKEAGMPEPEYDFVTNFVCLTIRFKNSLVPYLSGESNGESNGALNGELNDALKGLSESVKATYEIIRNNPGIQRKNIILKTNRGSSTIDRHFWTSRRYLGMLRRGIILSLITCLRRRYEL